MEQYLRLVTSTSPEAWTDWISIATAIHNNRRNATTKLLPNQILLGYETKLIPTGTRESTNEATERRLETMIKKRLAAIDAINQTAKARAPIPSQYKIGDQVWLEATHLKLRHQKTKLAPKRYGPFRVLKEISPVAYKLQLPVSWGIHDVFHASLLSSYRETAAHRPNFSQPPPDLIDGEEEYEVECIVNHRRHGRARQLQYLIKWKGYPESDNTWEPADQVHAQELVKLYHRHSPLESIKGQQIQGRVQCPPGLIYPPLLGVAKKAGPRLLQPSSILPRLAPASQPLSSIPNRQTTNHRPESRPPYSNSSPVKSSPNPTSCHGLSMPKVYTNSYSTSKTSYPSQPTENTLFNIGSTVASTIAHTTIIPAATTKACLPRPLTRLCPSNRPKRAPLGSTRLPSPSLSNSLEPLWLKRCPFPSPRVPPRHAQTNLKGSLKICLDPWFEGSWPPSGNATSNALLRRTNNEPAYKNLKSVSKKSSKYRMTYTRAPMASKPMTNDARPLPESPTKKAILWRQNGLSISKMDAWPLTPWEPPSTQCRISSTYMQSPPSTMKTNPLNLCPSGSEPPCIPMTPTGKHYTKKSTKWRIGALPLKSSGIGTFIGSSTGWRRRLSSCKSIWRGPDKLRSYVSIGSKQPEPTSMPNTVKVSSAKVSVLHSRISRPFVFYGNPYTPTTKTRVRVVRSSRGRLEV